MTAHSQTPLDELAEFGAIPVQGLASALVRVALADAWVLAAMSAAARERSSATTWGETAETTMDEVTQVLAGGPRAGTGDRLAGIT